MCVIIWQPEGETVPPEYLAEGAKANPDGWGIIGLRSNRNGQTIMAPQHGLKMDDFVDQAVKYAGHNALFHCRKQSKGVVDLENVHPYKIHVPGFPSVWMMHNGTLGIPLTIDPTRSDTWHLARFLENIPNLATKLQDKQFNETLEWLIGTSKLAFFSEDRATIINEKAGVWRDRCWYSNYLAFPTQVTTRTTGGTESTVSSTGGETEASPIGETGGTAIVPVVTSLAGDQPPSKDGDEVRMLDGTIFRYSETDSRWFKVPSAVDDHDDGDDSVDDALNRLVWSEHEPTLEEVIVFALSNPELSSACFLRLIVAARKFAVMDLDGQAEEEEEDSLTPTKVENERPEDYGFACG